MANHFANRVKLKEVILSISIEKAVNTTCRPSGTWLKELTPE
jgi:hypothetical protein